MLDHRKGQEKQLEVEVMEVFKKRLKFACKILLTSVTFWLLCVALVIPGIYLHGWVLGILYPIAITVIGTPVCVAVFPEFFDEDDTT